MPAGQPNQVSNYDGPSYAQSIYKPGQRARTIIAQGSVTLDACTYCIRHDVDCYVFRPKFKKCAFCTARDYDRPMCHLTGEPDPGPKKKRRKLSEGGTGTNTPDTVESGDASVTPLISSPALTPAPTPLLQVPATIKRPANSLRVRLAKLELLGSAKKESLETRVSKLEEELSRVSNTLVETLVKLDELESVDTQPYIYGRPANALSAANDECDSIASQASTATVEQESCEEPEVAIERTVGVEEWEDGERTPEHTVSHPVGWRPMNCSCARPRTLGNGSVMQRGEDRM